MSEQGPTVVGGRYELHSRLARGGMADVFLARDQLLDRPVAVKVLFSQFATDPKFVERFRREAQAAANLTHPNIVSIFDWGQEGRTYFIVMEYVEGRSLADVIKAEGRLHPNRVADIATDVATALGFAHRNGVINRDVKPGNVLMSNGGQVKVTDFGIATAVRDSVDISLTQAGMVMGTATYFSPEQAQGLKVDPRSDLYSLGVVMYECLAGHPPFTGETPVAIAYKHVHEPPVPLSQLGIDAPAGLEAITMKLLAKDPDDRYGSAEELVEDLSRFRSGGAVGAAGAAGAAAAGAAGAAAAGAAGVAAGAAASDYLTTEAVDAYDPTEAYPGDYVTYEDQGRSPWIAVGLVALLAALIIGGFLFFRSGDDEGSAAEASPTPTSEAETVEVPAVVGSTLDDAMAALTGAGFQVEVVRVNSREIPEDTVISQTPQGLEQAEPDSLVTIEVSAGPEALPVPRVTGSKEDEARRILEELGFVVETRSVESEEFAEGEVVSQTPLATELLQPGQTVLLEISTGPGDRPVPNVVGEDLINATQILAAAGFRVEQAEESSDTVPEGLVIRTDPATGTELQPETVVTIFLSTGPNLVEVPAVINLAPGDARARLEALGFEVVDSSIQLGPGEHPLTGLIVQQDPAEFSLQPPGTRVTIFVGLEPERVPVPDVLNLRPEEAVIAIEEANFVAVQQTVQVQPGQEDLIGLVVDQDPDGGTLELPTLPVTIFVGLAPPTPEPTPDPGDGGGGGGGGGGDESGA